MVRYCTLFKTALLKSNLVKSSWLDRRISTRRIHVSKRMTSSSANIARLLKRKYKHFQYSLWLHVIKGKAEPEENLPPFLHRMVCHGSSCLQIATLKTKEGCHWKRSMHQQKYQKILDECRWNGKLPLLKGPGLSS